MNKVIVKTLLFVKRNSSTILTIGAAAGAIVTPVLAVRATPKAIMLIEEAEDEKGEELTTFEKVITVGPVYIGPIMLGVSSIACMFGANILNKRKQAALISGYKLLETSYQQYQKKVEELHGVETDKEIKIAVANDKYVKGFHTEDEEIRLFFDQFSGRYFESSLADVVLAEYNFNRSFALRGHANLNEFYDFLGLPPIDAGDELGWSFEAGQVFYGYSWVDFEHTKFTMEDGLECYIIETPYRPTMDFDNYYGD